MKVTTIKRGGRNDERVNRNGFNSCFWICSVWEINVCSWCCKTFNLLVKKLPWEGKGMSEWMEWLFGIIGTCSVVLLFFVPSGILSSTTSLFFLSLFACTMLIIMFLMKRSKPIFYFSMIVMAIIVLQIITLVIYPTIIKAFH